MAQVAAPELRDALIAVLHATPDLTRAEIETQVSERLHGEPLELDGIIRSLRDVRVIEETGDPARYRLTSLAKPYLIGMALEQASARPAAAS